MDSTTNILLIINMIMFITMAFILGIQAIRIKKFNDKRRDIYKRIEMDRKDISRIRIQQAEYKVKLATLEHDLTIRSVAIAKLEAKEEILNKRESNLNKRDQQLSEEIEFKATGIKDYPIKPDEAVSPTKTDAELNKPLDDMDNPMVNCNTCKYASRDSKEEPCKDCGYKNWVKA